MTDRCTVCTHESRAAIDHAIIVDAVPYRNVAKQFGLSIGALTRHKQAHLARLLAGNLARTEPEQTETDRNNQPKQERALRTRVNAHQEAEQAHAVDLFASLARQVERLTLLSDAVDEWLRDPDHPEHYSVSPRADDVSVIYWEAVPGREPRRRKAKLSTLLGRLEGAGLSIEATETRYADPRELLGKVAEHLRGQLTMHVELLDRVYGARQVAAFEAAVLDAIAEVSPDVRASIERTLRRNHPLRRPPGPALG